MPEAITSAMLLAAGNGMRMRPLTLTKPKPLIEVAGKPLISYGLEKLRQHGVTRVVVNGHWLADQMQAYAQAHDLKFSDERDTLLDTGGGVKKALPLLHAPSFLVLNSDCFWLDVATSPALARLEQSFTGEMDCLLLLAPLANAVGYDGQGDFHRDAQGRLTRKQQGNSAPFVFAGAYLVRATLFEGAPDGPFSMNLLWDKAIAQGRLFGLVHEGLWLHVGTPDAIAPAQAAIAKAAR
jgi:MurNAc alpha-1-phosphate uridylyltransferase